MSPQPKAGARRMSATPARASAARRDSIVQAALELFADRGYSVTTMEDIGTAVNLRGPSLYKHVSSKQELLAEIMLTTMSSLQRAREVAVASTDDVVEQLRRAVEAHVRYHAQHRYEAFLGNRELRSLDDPNHEDLLRRRREYWLGFRSLIERGAEQERLTVRSLDLATNALLDMGIGVAVWFRDGGQYTVDEVAYQYGDLAMSMFKAR